MDAKEATWRLRNRALGLELGGSNAKFFDKFAEHGRVTNNIWEMIFEYGSLISSQASLTNLAVNFFQNLFYEPKVPRIEAYLKSLDFFL